MRVEVGFKVEEVLLSAPQSGDIRTLKSELIYYSELIRKQMIVVPVGVKTDLGSIPQVLQAVFPKDGKAMFAYILHDYLYQTGMFSRAESDDMLEEAMKSLGVGWLSRKSVKLGLYVGGWKAWNEWREVNGVKK
jgi:hypothetical protein